MRFITFTMLLVMDLATACLASDEVSADLSKLFYEHPRLFLHANDLDNLKKKIASDNRLEGVHDFILSSATSLQDTPPLTREKEGRRLLGVSREALRRISYLAFAYRMTDDPTHLMRAEQEMLAVSAFKDWNPSHFLDVAEMTAALAIGYDWLYNDLGEETRVAVRAAIVEKGLKTSLKGGWWVTTTNNWNQVCHGGLTMGALAVAEDEPNLAEQIVARALKNLPEATHEYEPDGVYPEGPSYWAYGTTYNVLLIDALESALGDDFETRNAAGLVHSPEFYLHVTGPTGLYYNFSDCGARGSIAPAMYWFASALDDAALLWREQQALDEFIEDPPPRDKNSNRMLVFMLIWAPELSAPKRPAQLHWKGDGPTPVAMHRSGWDHDSTFAGIKGGSPQTNHAHMDIGSFVIDMDGVRWAVDLGAQSYNSLESKGIDLWNRSQNSERWTVFRLNNRSHNTLVVDGQLQRVKGNAPIVRHSGRPENAFTIVDMSPVYEGQLARAERGLRLVQDQILIQDEIESLDRETRVRWGMATAAKAVTVEGNRAVLEESGKKLSLLVLDPTDARVEILNIAEPTTDYDATNPGMRMVIFEAVLPPSTKETLRVAIHRGNGSAQSGQMKPLADW